MQRSSRWLGWVLALLSAALRFWALAQTPYANGWDGYFYLVQLQSWVETGHMHTREAALIYPLLRGVQFVVPNYVLAFKVTAALLAGGFTAAVYAFGRATFPRQPRVAWVLAAWTVASPHLTYFAAQYPKNLLGAGLLVAFIASLTPFPRTAGRWLLAVALLLLNAVGHRLTFGVALIYAVVWSVCQVGEKTFHKRVFPNVGRYALVAGVILGLLLATLPGLLHLSDAERLGQWVPHAAHFAPVAFWQTFGTGRLSAFWQIEIVLVTLAFFAAAGQGIWQFLREKQRVDWPLLSVGVVLLWPFLEWSLTSLAYRMWLLFVLLGPLWLAFVLGQRKWPVWVYALKIGVLLLVSGWTWRSYQPPLHDPDYGLFAWVTQRSLNHLPPKTELVVAPNALAEYFTFTTRTDALPWLPEYAIAPDRCWRLATGVRWETVRYYAGDTTTVHRVGPYSLLREVDWQSALQAARAEGDSSFVTAATQWPNPARIRPAFLLRRKQQ